MKLQNMVKFPLSGLDMTPHVVKRSQSSWSLPSHWSPWRRPYGLGRDPEDYIYDLYAVCNHHGTMQGGHYTGKYPAILCTLDPSRKKKVMFSGGGAFVTLRNGTMVVPNHLMYVPFSAIFFFLQSNSTNLSCFRNAPGHST